MFFRNSLSHSSASTKSESNPWIFDAVAISPFSCQLWPQEIVTGATGDDFATHCTAIDFADSIAGSTREHKMVSPGQYYSAISIKSPHPFKDDWMQSLLAVKTWLAFFSKVFGVDKLAMGYTLLWFSIMEMKDWRERCTVLNRHYYRMYNYTVRIHKCFTGKYTTCKIFTKLHYIWDSSGIFSISSPVKILMTSLISCLTLKLSS